MKVAQMQPSLKWSITQRDFVEETGYHQVPCKAGKYKTKIFQLNRSMMNNVSRAWDMKEDWKQPATFLQQIPDRPSLAKIARRRYCSYPLVCRWKYCHNNQSNIDIFTRDNNKSVLAATTNTKQSQISAGALSEARQCFWRDHFLTKLTCIRLLTYAKSSPLRAQSPDKPTRLRQRWSSNHLSWKHPLLLRDSPYMSHWGHGLWTHACPPHNWKDRKILRRSVPRDTKSNATCAWPAWQQIHV